MTPEKREALARWLHAEFGAEPDFICSGYMRWPWDDAWTDREMWLRKADEVAELVGA